MMRLVGNNPASFPPVGDYEQFKSRFKALVKATCLSPSEADWVEVNSAKFGSQSDRCWSESDLASFLAITLPDELKIDLTAATPLLHRCLRRLGSFPFHISDPSPVLDGDTLSVGVVLLLRRYVSNLHSLHGDVESEEWIYRLLFQTLSDDQLPVPKAWPSPEARGGPDDEHLLKAHALISSFNKRRDRARPMVMHHGTPIVDISQLPPSRSQDFSGHFSTDEFRPFLRLLLASQLFLTGLGPEIVCREPDRLDASVESILKSFTDPTTPSKVTWKAFESALRSQAPNLFHGLSRLCGLSVLDGGLDHAQLRSCDKAQVVSKLQVAFASDFDVPELPVGAIFGPTVLAQLSTFLPLDIPLQSPTIMYSSTTDTLQGILLLEQSQTKGQPLILLINGFITTTDGSKDGNRCCYGAFLPQDPEHSAALFQLQPAHRVCSGAGRVSTKPRNNGIQTLQVHLRTANRTEIRLDVGGPGTEGRLFYDGLENGRFNIAAMDLVGFPPTTRSYDLKQDRRFWVGKGPPAQPPANHQKPKGEPSRGKGARVVAAASAVILAVQLGPLSLSFLPANPLSTFVTEAVNLSVTFGTPLFAWHVVGAVHKPGSLHLVGIIGAAVMAAPALARLLGETRLSTGLLLVAVTAWWVLAVFALSRRQVEGVFWWLRNIIVCRLVVTFLKL